MLLTDTRNREEVSMLDFLTSFLIAVLGGVACHYKRKEESLDCIAVRSRDSFLRQRGLLTSFAYRHYSICGNLFQYTFDKIKILVTIQVETRIYCVFRKKI